MFKQRDTPISLQDTNVSRVFDGKEEKKSHPACSPEKERRQRTRRREPIDGLLLAHEQRAHFSALARETHCLAKSGNDLLIRRPCPIRARDGWKMGVATTFVPGMESIELLEETLRALVAMDYSHETWALDEGDDEQVKALTSNKQDAYR